MTAQRIKHTVIFLAIISFVFVDIIYFHTNIDFEEVDNVCLTIPMEDTPNGIASWVLSSPEDLQRYLKDRESYHHLPFEGDLCAESLDFAHYDYVFCEGRPIVRMQRLPWDQCSSYDHEHLTPLFLSFGEQWSRKVYIYKIRPKNKYRRECG